MHIGNKHLKIYKKNIYRKKKYKYVITLKLSSNVSRSEVIDDSISINFI
jgi:hypothetical protein